MILLTTHFTIVSQCTSTCHRKNAKGNRLCFIVNWIPFLKASGTGSKAAAGFKLHYSLLNISPAEAGGSQRRAYEHHRLLAGYKLFRLLFCLFQHLKHTADSLIKPRSLGWSLWSICSEFLRIKGPQGKSLYWWELMGINMWGAVKRVSQK